MLYRIVALIESAYYIWYSKEKDTEITAETNYSMKVQTHHTHKKNVHVYIHRNIWMCDYVYKAP